MPLFMKQRNSCVSNYRSNGIARTDRVVALQAMLFSNKRTAGVVFEVAVHRRTGFVASGVPSQKILHRANFCFSEHEYFRAVLAEF